MEIKTTVKLSPPERTTTITHGAIVDCRSRKTPSERQEGAWLMQWANLNNIPLIHIANEGKRSVHYGRALKAQGLAKGFPDYVLWEKRKDFGALIIELKPMKGGVVSAEQKEWIERLTKKGYLARVCRGWIEAKDLIEMYLAKSE